MGTLTGDPLTDRLLPVAVELVGAVHYMGVGEIEAALTKAVAVSGLDDTGTLQALVVLLAAMVDDDRTVHELLAWHGNPDEYWRLRADGFTGDEARVLAAGWTEPPDEVAVQRCMDGTINPHALTVEERQEAIIRLHRRGLLDHQVAERTGVAVRTVQRVRKRLGIPANQQHGRTA